jgi:hypothetical protein
MNERDDEVEEKDYLKSNLAKMFYASSSQLVISLDMGSMNKADLAGTLKSVQEELDN